jgi:hypothetical protein
MHSNVSASLDYPATATLICEGDVAVRPHEINGIAAQAGPAAFPHARGIFARRIRS